MTYFPTTDRLLRNLEDLSTFYQRIIHGSLTRQASSRSLNFQRTDYPQMDPPEWKNFITLKLVNGKVKVGELPLAYWGNLEQNWEAHNKDCKGSYIA